MRIAIEIRNCSRMYSGLVLRAYREGATLNSFSSCIISHTPLLLPASPSQHKAVTPAVQPSALKTCLVMPKAWHRQGLLLHLFTGRQRCVTATARAVHDPAAGCTKLTFSPSSAFCLSSSPSVSEVSSLSGCRFKRVSVQMLQPVIQMNL